MKKTAFSHQSYFLFLAKVIALFAMAITLVAVRPVSAKGNADGGAIWYVSITGNDADTCATTDAPCLTINGAIDKAADGDTIQVAVGTYTAASGEEVVLINKSITLSGGWNETFTTQGDMSTIDGSATKRGITISTPITAVLERFIIQNGYQTNWASSQGAGIRISAGTLTINKSSIINNSGKGIYNSSGILTINNSSINNNKELGILNSSGTVILNNSTISSNTGGVGSSGNTTINNATIVNNSASDLYTIGGNSSIQNSIVSDCWKVNGLIISQGYNLIEDTTNCYITPTIGDQFNVDPQLGPLVTQTGTHPLTPTSPAIDKGDNNTCFGTADQRGQLRVDGPDSDADITCDIGAYEYTVPSAPAIIHSISGGGQHTFPNTPFPQPLKARVLDGQGNPVEAGVEVLFNAPISGASGNFEGSNDSISVLTDIFGVATTPSFIANAEFGQYVINATTSSVAKTAEFALENHGWYVSPNGSDVNDCKFPATPCHTINAAIGKTSSGDTIQIAVGTYTAPSGAEVVLINKNVTLSGGWDEAFITQNGMSTIDGSGTRSGITVKNLVVAVVDHFTIQNGYSTFGGGVYNTGTLTVNNSIIKNNISTFHGGGIYNSSGNVNPLVDGTLIINNTTISENKVINNTAAEGGGIKSSGGTVTLNSSTVSKNSIPVTMYGIYEGSGISVSGAILTLNNSTVSDNNGGNGGGNGIAGRYGGIGVNGNTAVINNSTITGNQFVGISYGSNGKVVLKNTILAGNGTNGDCAWNGYGGSITSQGYNLIGSKTDCRITPVIGDLFGTNANPIDAKLGPLWDNGGHTYTHALSGASPALDAGNPSTCLPTDQRGTARPQGNTCDMGAYEGYITTVISVARLDSNPTIASSVKYLVIFSESVTGVDSSDFTLVASGTTGASVTSVSGSDDIYTITVNTGAGKGNGAIRLKVTDDDSILDSSSTPLGGAGIGNGDFTAGEVYSLRKVPTALTPTNLISDSTPTFKWTKITGAVKYQIQLWKGDILVYSKNITAAACSGATCPNTPATTLNPGTYKWRVRAMIEETWMSFSPYKTFKLFLPKPGFWSWTDDSPRFYLLNSRPVVADFSILVRHPTCGIRRITHTHDAAINGRNFSLPGSFSVSGTFTNTTHVSGSLALYNYYIPGCGYGSGGPFSWTAVWKSNAQPALTLNDGDILELTVSPEFSTPFEILTVDPEK